MKQVIKNYTFNVAAKTITLTDFTTVMLDRLALITDTTNNVILYNFVDPSAASATVSGKVITLSALPTGVSNTDKLRIDYDSGSGDPTYDTPSALVSGSVTANLGTLNGASTAANQATANASLVSIDTKTPTNPAQEHSTAGSPGSVRLTDGAAYYKPTTPTDTQPVTASSLPLPTGAATASNQTTGNGSLSSLDSKTPALGQATAAASRPVVLASDKNVQLGGLDFNGNPTNIKTDTSGRLKISHGQPPAVAGTLAALNSQLAVVGDGFSDVIFYFIGTTVQTVTFEQSPDSTDGSNGTWFSVLATNQAANAAAAVTAALTASHVYRVSAPAGAYIRVRTSAYTSGSSSVQAVTTTAMAQSQVTSTLSSAVVSMTSTTIAAPAATIVGLTIGKVLSAASTNATSTKTTAARLQGWCLSNTTASYKYLKFFNKASAPTVGTDVPVYTVALPPNLPVPFSLTQPITFATGLAYSITRAFADNDATAVAAGDVVGAFFYV